MTLIQAQEIAKEWLKNNGISEGSDSYNMQFQELTKIIWMNMLKKLS